MHLSISTASMPHSLLISIPLARKMSYQKLLSSQTSTECAPTKRPINPSIDVRPAPTDNNMVPLGVHQTDITVPKAPINPNSNPLSVVCIEASPNCSDTDYTRICPHNFFPFRVVHSQGTDWNPRKYDEPQIILHPRLDENKGTVLHHQVRCNNNAGQHRLLGRVATNLLSRACKSIHDAPSHPSTRIERRDSFVYREITRLPRYSTNCCPAAAVKAKTGGSPRAHCQLLHSQLNLPPICTACRHKPTTASPNL